MGTDLVKDPQRAARPPTTTPQGVTAEFNRNVLRVLNRELDADFDPDDFEHVALFDRRARVDRDAPARAPRAHDATCAASTCPCTSTPARSCAPRSARSSRPSALEGDLAAAGLELVRWLTDPEELFALTLSRAAPIGRLRAPMQIEGSAAIVVGGASGLGEATVRALHERGAQRDDRRRQRREGRRRSPTSSASTFVACDVREEDQVEAAVAARRRGRRRAAHRGLLRRHRLGAEGRRLQGPAPAAAVRDDHPINLIGTFNVLRFAAARDDRQRAAARTASAACA